MSEYILELKNVSKNFNQGDEIIHALKQTNFSIKKGEFVAIIGPSGSGKSTFLTIAGALQTPSEGSVIINGQDISKMNTRDLSKVRFNDIGFILQSSSLVPFLTIDEQLRFRDEISKANKSQTKRHELLKRLDIYNLKDKYPDDISGGEKQRAAIAKVIYSDTNIILSDEPTASLDSHKAFDVVKILKKETHGNGKATIMVTHDDRLVKFCDKVYEMHDGSLRLKR